MKENNKKMLTMHWYQHKQLIHYLSLVPESGVDKDLFFSCLPSDDLKVEVQKYISRGWYVYQEGNRLYPLSPLLFFGIHPTEEHVIDFLNLLYMVLEQTVERYKKPDSKSIEDLAADLCRKVERLHNHQNLLTVEEKMLESIAPLIHQLKLPLIGVLQHQEEEIRRTYNMVEVAHYKHFGDERLNAVRLFHEEQGETICKIFQKAVSNISLSPVVQENMLDIMLEYFELTEMSFSEMAETAEKLLEVQMRRGASSSVLAWTHFKLSDAYLCSFKNNKKWLQLSEYHLEKGCQYAHTAYEEDFIGTVSTE